MQLQLFSAPPQSCLPLALPPVLLPPMFPEILAAIRHAPRFVPTGVRTVHYMGRADRQLIRALQAESRLRVSIMALGDAVAPCGVDAYVDGAPRHLVLLQDTPLDEGQVERLSDGRPQRKPMIVLWGDALASELPTGYDWRTVGRLRIGKRSRASPKPV